MLAMVAAFAAATVTGLSFALAFVISCSSLFGVQIALVQLANWFKSKVAEKLIGWYLLVCCWALVILFVVDTVLLVWRLL